MKMNNTMKSKNNSDKYIKAKKRVKDIKKFYKHLTFYIIFNVIFIGYRIYKDVKHGDSYIEAFSDISNYKIFFWWGIALLIHAFNVLGKEKFFSKNWEERKIKEYMDKN